MSTLKQIEQSGINYNKQNPETPANWSFVNFLPPSSVGSSPIGCFAPAEYSTVSPVTMNKLDNNLHTNQTCALNASMHYSQLSYASGTVSSGADSSGSYALVENSSANTTNGLYNCYIGNVPANSNNSYTYTTLWSSSLSTGSLNSANYATLSPSGDLVIMKNSAILTNISNITNYGTVPHTLSLIDTGSQPKIVIKDSTGTVVYTNLITVPSTIRPVQNADWLKQVTQGGVPSSMSTGPKQISNSTSTSNANIIKYLISSTGFYKLEMDPSGNLIVKCSISACSSQDANKNHYSPSNANSFYLYQPVTDPKMNKMFYASSDSGKNTLQNIPANNNPILSYTSTTTQPIGTFAVDSTNTNQTTVTSGISSAQDCLQYCNQNNCNFYYYSTNSSGTKTCSVGNPGATTFTYLPPATGISSQLYVNIPDISLNTAMLPKPIATNNVSTYGGSSTTYSDYTILPTPMNTPSFVGDPAYKQILQNQQKALFGQNAVYGQGAAKQTTFTQEAFADCTSQPGGCDCTSQPGGCIAALKQNISANQASALAYEQTQQKIAQQALDLSGGISSFYQQRQFLSDNPKYDYAGTTFNYGMFKKPTLKDGIQTDINTMMVQQNTMYIVGAITAATLLVTSIFIGKSA